MERTGDGTRTLRFAVMCRGTSFPAWQAQCIRHLLASGIAEPVLLIIEAARSDRPSERASDGGGGFGGMLYRLYDARWVQPRLRALRAVDLARELGALPTIACVALRPGSSPAILRQEEIAAICSHDLDFILQFAFDDIGGNILTAARLGVWTYQRGAERRHPGLAAFWAFYRRQSLHRAALLRLTDAAGGAVLHVGSFGAERSLARTTDAILLGRADWCARVARQVALARQDPFGEPTGSPFPSLHRLPGNGEVLVFLARRAAALARGAFRRCFLLESWNVGVVDAPIEQIVARGRPEAVRWLRPPPHLRYYADPFALPGRPDVLLIEEYSHLSGKGWISRVSSSPKGMVAQPIGSIAQNLHRSYPFLIRTDEGIFCIPECAEAERVELYRAIDFPERWKYVATLIEDFPALDSTVLCHDGRWWLFCTGGTEGREHKLHAWHAEALAGPWHPHPLNPLKCDVSSSRPAGRPFMVDGKLYRPAQDCSRTYGGAITINRVAKLTPTEFDEVPVGRIEPAGDRRYPHGLHTVCPLGDITIVDGKRFVFDVRAFYLKARAASAARRATSDRLRGRHPPMQVGIGQR